MNQPSKLQTALAAAGGGLDLTEDERKIAMILLAGTFEGDEEKVAAFDKMVGTLAALSPGKFLDLTLGVLKRTANPNQGADLTVMALQNPHVRDAYRDALGKAMRELIGEANISSFRAMDGLLAKLQKGHLLPEIQGAMVARARLLDQVYRAESQDAQAALVAIQDFANYINSDPELRQRFAKDMKRLMHNGSRWLPGGSFDDLQGSAARTAKKLDAALSRTHGHAREHFGKMHKLLTDRGASVDRYGSALRMTLQELRDLPDTSALHDAYRKILRLDIGIGRFDLQDALKHLEKGLVDKAAVETLGAGTVGALASLRRVDHMIANGPHQDIGEFWTELADLRAFFFSDPQVRREYHRSVDGMLTPLMLWEPGDTADHFSRRLEDMERAFRKSHLPEASIARLLAHIETLRQLAKNNDVLIQSIMGELHAVRKTLNGALTTPLAKLPRSFTEFFELIPNGSREQILRDHKNQLLEAARAVDALPITGGARKRLNRAWKRLFAASEEVADWKADFTGAAQSMDSLISHSGGEASDMHSQFSEWMDLSELSSAENWVPRLHAATVDSLDKFRADIEAYAAETTTHRPALERFRNMDATVRKGLASLDKLKDAEQRLRSLADSDPKAKAMLEADVLPVLESMRKSDWANVATSAAANAADLHAKVASLVPNRDAKIRIMKNFEPVFMDCIKQIENVAQFVTQSDQIKIPWEPYEIFFKMLLTQYYQRTQLKYKKGMLMDILALPAGSNFLDQFIAMVGESGPLFNKTLQVFAEQEGMGPEISAVFKLLLSGNKPVSFDAVDEALRASMPELYPARFKSITHKPVGTGTMAQTHFGEYMVDATDHMEFEAADGDTIVMAIRFIKPGMQERLDEDTRVMKEAVPVIAANPVVAKSPLAHTGDFIDALDHKVRIELNVKQTSENQRQGREEYFRDLNIKSKDGRRVHLGIDVPKNYKVTTADHGTMLMSVGKGTSFAKFFENDPTTFAAVAEQVTRTFVDVALFGSGFFHMDLHAGNMMAGLNPDGSIKVTILDFGMQGSLSAEHRAAFMRLDQGVATRDLEGVKSAVRDLLVNQLDDQVVHTVLKNLYDAGGAAWTADSVIGNLTQSGGKIPDDFLDFNRAILLVDQFLAKSQQFLPAAKRKTMAQVIADSAKDAGMREIPKRIGHALRGNVDERYDTGLPVTNRELWRIVKGHWRQQKSRLMEKVFKPVSK